MTLQNFSITNILDPAGLRGRRAAYFAFVRTQAARMFKPDGTYQPETEPDGRIAYWVLPAFLESADAAEREFGLTIYAAGAGWGAFDVFMTSCVAAHLVRHHRELTPELRRRSEEHLARFTIAGNGRLPSANVYDYMFHGYNDNMPAMATRTMLLAGDVLGRPDFTDAGLFHLESLAAHFHRRGLLSEYTSATYTPICLASLLDIAECAVHKEARELAQACADRVLLDILGHWHWETGSTGGTMARAYTTDVTETLSVLNAYIWYISGHPLTIDPRVALGDAGYDGPMHHGRNRAFNLAQFVEVMNATHAGVKPALVEFARRPRAYPYTIRATADWSDSGGNGGARGVQTRSFQQPQYWLATSSTTNMGGVTGQTLVLHGALAAVPQPASWRDRVSFWTRLIADAPDSGEPTNSDASPHAGALAHRQVGPAAESDHVTDWGRYQTVQQGNSAMIVGGIGPDLEGRDVAQLRFGFLATAWHRLPDEIFDNDQPVPAWEGPATPHSWQFLRYGDVYVGVRLSAMMQGVALPVRRALRYGYLRLETPVLEGPPRRIDTALRAWTDFGCLVEIGSRADAGTFAEFRRAVLATAWEFHHNFYRSSRWLARSGELQIVDSVLGGTARFLAMDGAVETETKFAATGLDPALTELFPDGRRVRQRRTLYRPDCVTTPFYDKPGQILESQ